jgi:zinc protease
MPNQFEYDRGDDSSSAGIAPPEYTTVIYRRRQRLGDVEYVRDAMQATFAEVRAVGFEESRIADMKSHLRYSFASRLDNSEAIAAVLVPYVARTRDPESLNRRYAQYAALDAKTLRDVASKYFVDRAMVTTTLAHGPLQKGAEETGSVDARVGRIAEDRPSGAVRTILQHSTSPLITLRLAFFAGAARDPEGAEGLAQLTAASLADGSSRRMSIEDIKKAMFPMAAELSYQVDQELTVFHGTVHKDNFDAFYALLSAQLFDPGLLEADFSRVRDDLLNSIKTDLRANNDEELGKEALREMIYRGHPYGHLSRGRIDAIERLTVADVRDFYRRFYGRGNAMIAMAGDFSEAQAARIRNDLSKLGGEAPEPLAIPPVKRPDGVRVRIVEKDTRATAISFGFPIEVTRSHPDFPALWLVRSYFGEHRSSNSFLFQKLREIRGLNYGDYAYIEYFPRGMFKFHPDPNLWRKHQIFEVWIRPVVPENGHFALRAAKYELDRLVKNGMTASDFEETRSFLLKFMSVLTKTQDGRLGYAMDSELYGIPEFVPYMTEKLKALTIDDVRGAVKKHLASKSLDVLIVTKDAAGLRDRLVAGTPSPIRYESEKTAEILAEDKEIATYDLGITADGIEILPLEKIFR